MAVVIVCAVVTGIAGAIASAHIIKGRNALDQARTSVEGADLEGAVAHFHDAQAAFAQGHGGLTGGILRIAGAIPWLGNTPDTVVDIASAGEEVAAAGGVLSTAISEIPGGLEGLGVDNGRIPLGALESLATPASEAMDHAVAAAATLDGVPRSSVPGQVTDAVDSARLTVHETADTLRGMANALAVLPQYLGADGARTYVVAAQNPTEIWGTGGLIGEFALMHVNDGQIDLGRFHPISELSPTREPRELDRTAQYTLDDVARADVPSWYDQRIIDQPIFANLTPRAGAAAGYFLPHIRRQLGIDADGVIFMTPQALPHLLEVTGPVFSPQLDTTLTRHNVVRYTTNGVYGDFGESESRKQALGEAAHSIWDALLANPKASDIIGALASAAGSGSLVLTSTDPAEQQKLEEAGIGGRWGPPTDGWDFAGITASNEAGNKVDFYLRPRVTYDILLQPDGAARTTATVVMKNDAPRNAGPSYVMGPYQGSTLTRNLAPGTDILKIAQHCNGACIVDQIAVDGRPALAQVEEDGSTTIIGAQIQLLPQQSRTIEYGYTTPAAWEVQHGRGIYRLRLAMPQTITPFDITVRIVTPEGTNVLWTIPETTTSGDTVEWSGPVTKAQDLEVVFDKSFLGKLADSI